MGQYDTTINSTWETANRKGGVIDVIREVTASYDAEDDIYTYVQGDLSAGISASIATLNLINIANGVFTSTGVIKLNDEFIKYAAASGGTLSELTRGYKGSTAAIHALSDTAEMRYGYYDSRVIFSKYRKKEIDGHTIQQGDKKLQIPGKNAKLSGDAGLVFIAIDTKSLIVFGNEVYRVMDVETVAPDGVSKILFVVQSREQ